MPIVKLTNEFLNHSLTCPEGKRRIDFGQHFLDVTQQVGIAPRAALGGCRFQCATATRQAVRTEVGAGGF